jgi:antitoxin component HigA of HigAB toxin-antitoxin module
MKTVDYFNSIEKCGEAWTILQRQYERSLGTWDYVDWAKYFASKHAYEWRVREFKAGRGLEVIRAYFKKSNLKENELMEIFREFETEFDVLDYDYVVKWGKEFGDY